MSVSSTWMSAGEKPGPLVLTMVQILDRPSPYQRSSEGRYCSNLRSLPSPHWKTGLEFLRRGTSTAHSFRCRHNGDETTMRLQWLAMMFFVVVALGISSTASAGNLVTNGSFETGDFTGWTQFGDTSFTGVTGSFLGFSPTDGSYQAYFGPTQGIGGIEQTFSTVPGTNYNISFDLGNYGYTPTQYFVTFGSTELVDVVDPPGFPTRPSTTWRGRLHRRPRSRSASLTFLLISSWIMSSSRLPSPNHRC